MTPTRESPLSPPRSSSRAPKLSSGTVSVMRPVSTFTTPPMALEPYSSVLGPFSTSTRSVRKGSTVTMWSELLTDTSMVSVRSWSMSTRAPAKP